MTVLKSLGAGLAARAAGTQALNAVTYLAWPCVADRPAQHLSMGWKSCPARRTYACRPRKPLGG